MADIPALTSRLSCLARQIARRHYSDRRQGRQNTSIALLLSFPDPTPILQQNATPRFRCTYLDPFKNAVLESGAREMALPNRERDGRDGREKRDSRR